jgi:hypothetical protein
MPQTHARHKNQPGSLAIDAVNLEHCFARSNPIVLSCTVGGLPQGGVH